MLLLENKLTCQFNSIFKVISMKKLVKFLTKFEFKMLKKIGGLKHCARLIL